MADEKTSTKLIYAPKPAKSESFWERMKGAKSNFKFLGGAVAAVLILTNLGTLKPAFERVKETVLAGRFGKSVAEKAARLDAEVKATGAAIVKPLDMAKKAVDQASSVPKELLEAAPEIKAEDVMGKSRAAAAAAAAAERPAAENNTSAAVASTPSAGTIAKTAEAGTTAAPPGEDPMFAKCQVDAEFCHSTGLMFIKDSDFKSAFRFFSQGCDMNLSKACAQASLMLQHGLGVARSDTMAFGILEKSCALKDGASCTSVGLAYLQGTGVGISTEKAREAIDQGCLLGHGPACLLLGLAVQPPPAGVARSPASAAENLAKGCTLLGITTCAGAGGVAKHK